MIQKRIDIYHNILWSRYKAEIFSHLHRLAAAAGQPITFTHIADTDVQRMALTNTDRSAHHYPYEVLFEGAYSRIPKWKLMLTLARRAWSSRADLTIIAGYDKPEYWVQALVLRLRNKKIGVFCDSTIFDRRQSALKGLAKRLFLRLCSCALAYGTRSQEYLEALGMPRDRIFKDCQAAAVPARFTPDVVECLRRGAPLSEGPRILYVGRLAPEKRIDMILRAFPAVLARYPAARLIVVGKGEQEQALKQLNRSLDLDQSVDFVGAKPPEDLWNDYLAATCLVLASDREPWGLVVNEALTLGCPVVVSDRCGCVPELVIDGATGYSFASGDVADLTSKLLRLLDEVGPDQEQLAGCVNVIAKHSPAKAAEAMLGGLSVTLANT